MGLFDNMPIVKAKSRREASLAEFLASQNKSNDFLSSTSNSVLNSNTVGDQRFAVPDYGFQDLSKNRIIDAPVGLSSVGEFNMNNPLEVNKPITNPVNTGFVAGTGSKPQANGNGAGVKDLYSNIDTSSLYDTSGQDTALPSVSDQFTQDNYNVPDIGLNGESGSDFNWDKTVSPNTGGLFNNLTDFSTPEATKNSLSGLSSIANVGTSIFSGVNGYMANNAKADYQNKVLGLYEKQYADTEARRAKAQANYDASN